MQGLQGSIQTIEQAYTDLNASTSSPRVDGQGSNANGAVITSDVAMRSGTITYPSAIFSPQISANVAVAGTMLLNFVLVASV